MAGQSEWRRRGFDFADLIAELRGGMIGRDPEIALVRAWIEAHMHTGGLLWIGGRPGIGKSAVVAEAAHRIMDVPGLLVVPYFFRQGDARCDADQFYLAGALRLSETLGIVLPPGSQASEKTRFRHVLEGVQGAQANDASVPSVLFLLDGMDEAARRHPAVVSVPLEYASPRLLWICAGRADAALRDLSASAAADRLWAHGELPALAPEVIRELIERECEQPPEAFITQLVTRSEGLPLYVRLVVADIRAGRMSYESPDMLPGGIGPYFDALIARVEAGPPRELVECLLCLLCWTFESMPEKALAEILRVTDPLELEAAVRASLMVLRQTRTPEEEQGWMLYHLAFREHLLASDRLAGVHADVKQRLLDWCAGWRQHRHPYALRAYADHLLVEARHDALYQLARDSGFHTVQTARLVNQPDVPLRTVRAALEAAVGRDDAAGMAEFSLRHARLLKEITRESPLQALRTGNPERALGLADLVEPERGAVWHLLIAWELQEAGRQSEAVAALQRLVPRELPKLSFDTMWYGVSLLMRIMPLDQELFFRLQDKLLDGSAKGHLCYRLAQAGFIEHVVRIIPGIGDPMWQARAMVDVARARFKAGQEREARSVLAGALEVYGRIANEAMRWSELERLVEEQAEEGDFEGALAAARAFKDDDKQAKAFSRVARAQAEAGQVDGSWATAKLINVCWRKVRALAEVAAGALMAGRVDQARSLLVDAEAKLGDIDEAWQRAVALAHVGATCALLGDEEGASVAFQQATRLADGVEEQVYRAGAMRSIVSAMVRARRIADALALARKIPEEGVDRHNAFAEIMRAQMKAGEFDAAIAICRQDFEPRDQAYSLQWIARQAREKGDAVTAAAASAESLAIAETLYDTDEFLAYNTAADLAREGRFDEALRLARRAGGKDRMRQFRQQHALREIAQIMVDAGDGPAARSLIDKNLESLRDEREAHEDRWLSSGLEDVASTLAKQGHYGIAAETAGRIPDPQDRARAWLSIAKAQAKAGDMAAARHAFATAVESASSIEDKGNQVFTLQLIGRAQAKVGELEEARATFAKALEVANAYSSPELSNEAELRATFIIQVAEAQAVSGDIATALEVARGIDYPWGRVQALTKVAAAQASAGGKDAAQGIIAEAITAIQAIDDESMRAELLAEIALIHRMVGDDGAAQKALARAIDSAKAAIKGFLEVVKRRFASWTRREYEQSHQQGKTWGAIAYAHARLGDADAAMAAVRRIEDKRGGFASKYVEQAIKALAEAGQVDAALLMAQELEVFDREHALQAIGFAQIQAGDLDGLPKTFAALETCTRAPDQQTRERYLSSLAVLQVWAGFGEQAIRTTDKILASRASYIPSVAYWAAWRGDKATFKRLLLPCSYDIEATYRALGYLAILYPDQVEGVSSAMMPN